MRHNESIPFNNTKSQWSSINLFNTVLTPWNFNTFWIQKPWLSCQYRLEKESQISYRMSQRSNHYKSVFIPIITCILLPREKGKYLSGSFLALPWNWQGCCMEYVRDWV